MSQNFTSIIAWFGGRRTSSTPNTLPINDIEKGLQSLCCVPGPDTRPKLPSSILDSSFREISALLQQYESHKRAIDWHRRPRIYTVLRLIDRLDVMDLFVSQNYMDSDIPFPPHLLPLELGDSKGQFLAIQDRCLTTAIDLEKGVDGKHLHFSGSGDDHFHVHRYLGSGGYGYVDHVWSRLSHRHFARKKFQRGRRLQEVREFSRVFSQEISAMKRLSHRHLVKIVGSYTDSSCFAFLMEPVAQCNMLEFLQSMDRRERPKLRKFFGCLSNAITYLHDQKMHHMDIKLENILIKHEEVFVGDFGTAHDFSRKERSTTWSTAPRTARYMPPEIARDPHSPKNYATDIWSLGIVFLEMTAVLRGQSLNSFRSYLLNHGTQHQFVYGNQAATHSYFELLRIRGAGPEYDNEPLSWVKDMIHPDSISRPTARDIRNQILQSSSAENFRSFCCAGTDQIWDALAHEALGDIDEADEEDFYEANAFPDNIYNSVDSSKAITIESWLNQGSHSVPPDPLTEILTEDEGLPFDIEDDEETMIPSRTKEPALDRIPGRLANFDFLDTSSYTSHLPRPDVCENEGDELPFDIDVDDANSLDSEITVRPPVNTLGSHAKEILQILDDLDKVASSPGLPGIISHVVSDETPFAASQMSANSNSPRRTTSNLLKNNSTGPPNVFSSHDVSDEINPYSPSQPSPKLLLKQPTVQIPAKKAQSLTLKNLRKLEQLGNPHIPKRPIDRKLETYKAYMQDVWEAESSQATSVMSKETRRKLSGSVNMSAWQDLSFDLLTYYASKGKVQAVRLLLERGCNPGTKKNPRPRVLLSAVRGGSARHTKCVRALLDHAADVNVRSANGKTPLHIAIEHRNFKGYSNLIYTLLDHGANPNVRDNNGDFPLLQILYGGYESLEPHRRDALALILEQTHFTTDVNIMPLGTLNMPLHLAVRRKDPWAVGMLLAKEAAVNQPNGAGVTPLALAASAWNADMTEAQIEVTQLLLENGAAVHEPVGSSGNTLLHIAQTHGRTDLIDLLLEFSTDSER